MLTRFEHSVMGAVFALCDGKDGCLVSPLDIMSIMPSGKKNSPDRIDDALKALQSDGYVDIISSERLGEKMYVISLKGDGADYIRLASRRRKDLTYKIFLAFIGALATFVFTLLIKLIFKN